MTHSGYSTNGSLSVRGSSSSTFSHPHSNQFNPSFAPHYNPHFTAPRFLVPSPRRPVSTLPRSILHRASEIVELKRRTRCNHCGLLGHWCQECPHTISKPVFQSQNSATGSPTQALFAKLSDSNIDSISSQQSYSEMEYYPFHDFHNDQLDHITDQQHWFTNYTPLPSETIWPVETPAGHTCYVTSIGDIKILVQLPNRTEIQLLQQVLYIPGSGQKLFSLIKVAMLHKIFTLYKDTTCELLQDDNLIMTGRMLQGSYILNFTVLLPPAAVSYAAYYGNIPSSKELQTIETWHLQLAHLHYDMIKKMASNGSVNRIRLKTTEPPVMCSDCAHRKPFPKSLIQNGAKKPGMLIHSNICGPMSVSSFGGSLYYILFQDDSTRYRFVFCISRKSDALICFQRVCKTILQDTGYNVHTLQTDNACEFCSQRSMIFYKNKEENIRTPEQNAVSERDN